MAFVFKRATDKARGKAGKWTCHFLGPDGRWKTKAGVTDKAESQRIANRLEEEARRIRDGEVDLGERGRRQAALRPVAEHCRDYQEDLLAKGDTAKHATRTGNALIRLLESAGAGSVADITPDRVRGALGRMRASGKSARTCNYYLTSLKAFARWLANANRIDVVPRGLDGLKPYNEREDRRLVRRALSRPEIDSLLAAAERGRPVEASRGPRTEGRVEAHVRYITGPERAALYRLAMGTGFRADELRTLTPERFALDGDEPTVTVLAGFAKNGREAVQPITRELAAGLKPFLAGKPAGRPVLAVPVRTAKMLRVDLAEAGIPAVDGQGRVIDFHCFRSTFITNLIMLGVNPKIVQHLARHSTITLTLDRYTTLQGGEGRAALEGLGGPGDEVPDPDVTPGRTIDDP